MKLSFLSQRDRTTDRDLKRIGYRLMTLAQVGQLGCFVMFLYGLAWPYRVPSRNQAIDPLEIALVSGLLIIVFLLQMVALRRLFRIGKLLNSGEMISAGMAKAWSGLLKPVVWSGILSLALGSDPAGHSHGISGWLFLYLLWIVGLCLYAVSRLLTAAVAIQAENEEFI